MQVKKDDDLSRCTALMHDTMRYFNMRKLWLASLTTLHQKINITAVICRSGWSHHPHNRHHRP